MGFFSTLMGLEQDENSTAEESFDVLKVINSHVQWKVQLESYLNGTLDEKLDPKMICRDDQCQLGLWMQGPALQRFDVDNVLFKTLHDDHARFHVIACQVVEKAQANDKAAAQALMRDEYSQMSHKVVQDLTELKKHLTG